MPTISISSPTLTTPRSTRPVTTVPRPEIENTSSTGIRNGLSIGALGRRDVAVQRFGQLHDGAFAQLAALVAFHGQLGRALDDRGVVAGKSYLDSSSRTSISTSSSSSASSTMSHLFMNTMMYGTPT